MKSATQRAVIVTRPTWYDQLVQRHSTRQQAEFFLASRDQSLEEVESQHRQFESSLAAVTRSIPTAWRRARVQRSDLDRFLFEPQDVVIVLGQDGLVANVAKYLGPQVVIGVNPSPEYYDGVLVRHAPNKIAGLVPAVAANEAPLAERTKVHAELEDGQSMTALNELFVGHERHQSARYELSFGDEMEFQSSSGVIVATGTGATGWAKSIHKQSHSRLEMPDVCERRLIHFTREAWPSQTTGSELTAGQLLRGETLNLVSRMERGGVIFGDGMESDRLEFNWGRVVKIRVATSGLRVPAEDVAANCLAASSVDDRPGLTL